MLKLICLVVFFSWNPMIAFLLVTADDYDVNVNVNKLS